VSSSLRSSLDRIRDYIWPITQAAVGAEMAWFLAHTVLSYPQPFFAPIAAVVALAVGAGGRGTQAVQMLVGVAVGVVGGELLVLVLGTGTLEVALSLETGNSTADAQRATPPGPTLGTCFSRAKRNDSMSWSALFDTPASFLRGKLCFQANRSHPASCIRATARSISSSEYSRSTSLPARYAS
jgi:hypothetical protein